MNQHDRANLEFLLTLNTRGAWNQWACTQDHENLQYARSLLEVGRLEIIDQVVDGYSDLAEAQMLVQYIKERI